MAKIVQLISVYSQDNWGKPLQTWLALGDDGKVYERAQENVGEMYNSNYKYFYKEIEVENPDLSQDYYIAKEVKKELIKDQNKPMRSLKKA